MKYVLYLILPCLFFLGGCNNYLDLVPEKDIETIETVFEKRENADEWLKGCYSFLAQELASCSGNPAMFGSDEVVSGEYVRNFGITIIGFKIADGLQMAQEPYANIWAKSKFYTAIRYCNIFIENIDHVYNMEDVEKKQWKAEAKALKALLYFELVRRYGPIVLVPENIDVASDISVMQQPRSHVDTCFKAIVNLLDEASRDLLPFDQKAPSRYAYFNLE
ncbi:MAG: RagB/SusD family nutrient uptake outer membrane protein, partial [Odoribacter sp.]|nr:RagB/SusD family nutrient uptake outer membrane protein [Odoribacter sp.]